MRDRASRAHDHAAVAVHVERHDGVREAAAITIEEQECVGEGVAEAFLVQRLVGIGHRHAGPDQARGKLLGAVAAAVDAHGPITGLTPAIGPGLAAAIPPGLQVEVVVEPINAERRNDVLAEVFVLVIADQHDEVRLEVVDHLPLLAEVRPHPLSVALDRGAAFVVAHLGQHFARPVGAILVLRIDVGRRQDVVEEPEHALGRCAERRIMRGTQPENFAHDLTSNDQLTGAILSVRRIFLSPAR